MCGLYEEEEELYEAHDGSATWFTVSGGANFLFYAIGFVESILSLLPGIWEGYYKLEAIQSAHASDGTARVRIRQMH